MISLHATKAFGVGEGGLVLSTSEQVIHRLRQVCNFGIWGSEEGQILGYNGKLSEYHAAVGLAALDGWAMRRTELMSRTLRYSQELKRLPSVALLPHTVTDGCQSTVQSRFRQRARDCRPNGKLGSRDPPLVARRRARSTGLPRLSQR